jgi:hypothetical protein
MHMHKDADYKIEVNGQYCLVNYERYQKMLLAKEFFF